MSPLIYIVFVFRQKKGENIAFIVFNPFVDSLVRTKRGRIIYWFVFTLTPLLMIDKNGEKYFSIYACYPCFIHKKGERIFAYAYCLVLQKRREEFDEFLCIFVLFCKKGEKNLMSFMLDWHVYLLMFAYLYLCLLYMYASNFK